jgi:beta-phosphoglucomutase-like phosphatase (HAD superfamily)
MTGMLESFNSPSICAFDLDDTLVNSPLDRKRMSREIETLVRKRIGLPEKKEDRWSRPEILSDVRSAAPALEAELLKILRDIERQAMLEAVLIPNAKEAVEELRHRGLQIGVMHK